MCKSEMANRAAPVKKLLRAYYTRWVHVAQYVKINLYRARRHSRGRLLCFDGGEG